MFYEKMAAVTSMVNKFTLKVLKNEINYCALLTSSLFSNFQGLVRVKQLSVSVVMLEKTQIQAIQNGLNQSGLENLPIH